MPETVGSRTILLDLNVENTQSLLLEPAFNYDNPIQRQIGAARFVFGRDKYRMLHMSKPGNMLAPRSNCDTWNPTVRVGLRPDEIAVCDFELNGEQCHDEFEEGCLRNIGVGPNPSSPGNPNTPELNAIEGAIVSQVRAGLTDDIYKIAWFGDTSFAGTYDLNHLNNDHRNNLETMLDTCDGWWKELRARTTTTNVAQKVVGVDSNGGTASTNALLPANITGFLKQMRLSSNPILRFWNLNKPITERPIYMLQSGLFNALEEFYENTGVSEAHQFIIDGAPVPGVLTFNGFLVVQVAEWDMFDNEIGNIQTTGAWAGQSKTQRALFIARENLTGVANVQSIENYPGSGLVIQRSPYIKDKGKLAMFARLGLGFGIAAPQLVTVGYNSSTTYAAT